MIEAQVARRWRWYQVGGLAVTSALGLGLMLIGVAAGNVALWVIGAVWLVMGIAGTAGLRKAVWSIVLDHDILRLDGPFLHRDLPASDVDALTVSGLVPWNTILRLDTASLGRLRFGPLQPDATDLVVALRSANTALGGVV